MTKHKLTLSVDARVAEAAKRFASTHDTSVSQLVEDFLAVLVRPSESSPPPVLDRLRGSLTGVELDDWRAHLDEKYGR